QGLARLQASDAALAIVPLPFFLKHADDLKLEVRLMVDRNHGATERWSLAAAKDHVTSPSSLAGWEITGQPGYAPGFVRGPILASWGPLPPSAHITFSTAPLPRLRRALGGEKVAVLLDDQSATALRSQPTARGIEIVTTSHPLPATVVATVG